MATRNQTTGRKARDQKGRKKTPTLGDIQAPAPDALQAPAPGDVSQTDAVPVDPKPDVKETPKDVLRLADAVQQHVKGIMVPLLKLGKLSAELSAARYRFAKMGAADMKTGYDAFVRLFHSEVSVELRKRGETYNEMDFCLISHLLTLEIPETVADDTPMPRHLFKLVVPKTCTYGWSKETDSPCISWGKVIRAEELTAKIDGEDITIKVAPRSYGDYVPGMIREWLDIRAGKTALPDAPPDKDTGKPRTPWGLYEYATDCVNTLREKLEDDLPETVQEIQNNRKNKIEESRAAKSFISGLFDLDISTVAQALRDVAKHATSALNKKAKDMTESEIRAHRQGLIAKLRGALEILDKEESAVLPAKNVDDDDAETEKAQRAAIDKANEAHPARRHAS